MREPIVPREKEYLVASCICDSTGFRVGIVNAHSEREAMEKLGYEIIGHEVGGEFDWVEYLDRHEAPLDEDFFDFIMNQEGERPKGGPIDYLPIKRAYPYLDRLEKSFNRWILVAEIDHAPVGEFLICYYDEKGMPKLVFVEAVAKAWIAAHPEFFIEVFKWNRDTKVFEDVSEQF